MPEIIFDDFKNAYLAILSETMQGPQDFVAYLNRGSGFFPSLAQLSSDDASRRFTGQTTIAAHVKHSIIHLNAIISLIKAKPKRIDWPATWQKTKVSDDEWQKTIADLEDAHNTIVSLFGQERSWQQKEITAALAALVHLAYHLAAIRQIMLRLNEK